MDPATGEHMALRDHILMTMDKLGPHAGPLGASSGIHLLRSSVELSNNDARWLRELQGKEKLLAEVIRQADAEKYGIDSGPISVGAKCKGILSLFEEWWEALPASNRCCRAL